MRYSLKQVQVFLKVAHYENISKAARDLAMSQSAVSSALSDFERHYDIWLFDRNGKKLQLNGLGRALRPQAQALYEQAQAFEQQLQQQNTVPALRVGATLTIGNYLAVGIMAQYMRQHAAAQVQLHVANTASIGEQVRNFELDVGLIEGELQSPDLKVIPWLDDELVVFCSPTHPLAKRRSMSDKDLLAAAWILRESGSGTRQTFDRAMTGLLSQLNISLELEHTEAIKRAVEADLGISCLSRVALKEAFARGSLIPLKVPQRDLRRRFYFILHRQKYLSSAIESWMALCNKEQG
ncbi:LysR family transcriptional regulator [Gammaproteobacteria bacterium 53_120_T64]|nr:LysR family transcriptional regulator [Gammaproteobacteria bacterium 53_120_T64]